MNYSADQAVRVVRAFLDLKDIEILADGQMKIKGAARMATCAAEVDRWLQQRSLIDADWVIDNLIIEGSHGTLKERDLKRALRHIVREERKAREHTVYSAFLAPKLSRKQRNDAKASWRRLARQLFNGDPELNAAVLQHFIWQTKQKVLGRTVDHHLMPIISSSLQGTGKTTFVWKFLEPLKELAHQVTLASIADSRSGDIYGYPVLLVDDVDPLHPSTVPHLKSILTGNSMRRRLLGTSRSATLMQRATFIGTANQDVRALVIDETGHRRFFELRFKNGNPARGGDRRIWNVVTNTDYLLLWSTVDAFKPAPIQHHLKAIAALEATQTPIDPIGLWLQNFDPDSAETLKIRTPKGIGAHALYQYYLQTSGKEISEKRFAEWMQRHTIRPDGPFEPKEKRNEGVFYKLKVGWSPAKPSDGGERHGTQLEGTHAEAEDLKS